jgi:hypothetical protein
MLCGCGSVFLLQVYGTYLHWDSVSLSRKRSLSHSDSLNIVVAGLLFLFSFSLDGKRNKKIKDK